MSAKGQETAGPPSGAPDAAVGAAAAATEAGAAPIAAPAASTSTQTAAAPAGTAVEAPPSAPPPEQAQARASAGAEVTASVAVVAAVASGVAQAAAEQSAEQAQGAQPPSSQPRFDYRQVIRKRFVFLLGGLFIGLVLAVVDLLTGAANVAPGDVLCVISHWATGCEAPKIAVTVVKVYRVPTVLTAIGVGASLGVAGSIMQTILRNPLASPYTLGISAGAGFGAALTIVTGFAAIDGLGVWLVPFNAFVFALLTCFLIYGIGSFKKLTPGTMILAGIGLSFLFNALQSMMQYGATAEQNQNIVFWLFGSLSKSDTPTALLMIGLVLVLLPVLMARAWQFTTLQLGDEKAMGLGVNVKRLRLLGFGLASLLTATAVSFVGTIGFVGLAGPHVARLLVGEDQRFFMPLSALFGALILLLADIVSKSLIEGFVFPIGIITSLIGVPVFFSVVLSKRRSSFS